MNPQNTGSFGAPAGGMGAALAQVMQQRQSGQYPATAAVTNGAPTAGNVPGPASPPTAPAPSSMPSSFAQMGQDPAAQGMTPQDQGAPTAEPATPFDSPEAKIIINSLSTRLKGITELQKAQVGVHPSQQPPKPQLSPPTQGGA